MKVAKSVLQTEEKMNGRAYLYYEDRALSSDAVPIFIPETSALFNDEKFRHLPVITEEQFDLIVKEEARIKKGTEEKRFQEIVANYWEKEMGRIARHNRFIRKRQLKMRHKIRERRENQD